MHRHLGRVCLASVWILYLVVLEEIHEVALVWLKSLLGGKLVNAKFLHNLEDVKLLAELALRTLEQKVTALLLWPQTTAALLVEAP